MEKNINLKEIKELSKKVLHNKKGIGLEAKYIENEYERRIETYNKILAKVETNLIENEEIITGKINVPHSSGTGGMSVVLYYQGIFFTNKRIFIFDMNFKYEELEEIKFRNVKDIVSLKENKSFDGLNIIFDDNFDIFLKGYSFDEKSLIEKIQNIYINVNH
ncbi:MAG: hypothetical protein ACRCTZ_00750 [Sarcina sp.]